ncbi:uncharacterized protein LOC117327807 [Pecten maximus]|uniref:uncharacterized protein LOC117327807 n=1 Tax=Pecten maximus TaxID=6579 RepID=UPI001458A50C|nr:uncharacterized protein LOC117327807 [Pecten maximus]XP_033740885.1 uncharacterized protein LOC117327807 [Pecten maximus]
MANPVFGPALAANEDIRMITAALKDPASTFLDNRSFEMFEAIQFKEQQNMIQGSIFIIKVQISKTATGCIFIKIFIYQRKRVITGVLENQALDNTIQNFN